MTVMTSDNDRRLGRSESASNVSAYWKHHLFLLQESAPKPMLVPAPNLITGQPPFYGSEFHGLISRDESSRLLALAGEGSFLVRQSQRAEHSYTLCIRFDGTTKNYKLYYDGQHFVGEKRFDTVEQLVADGLISMYIERHAAEYIRRMAEETIYEESPYSQYQKLRQRHCLPCPHPKQKPFPDSGESPQRNCPFSPNRMHPVEILHLKNHRFKANTFLTPHWCDYCGNYMWGLVSQGVKCEECGFVAHRKCSEKTLPDCRPDLKYVKRTFGVDLTTFSMAHNVRIPPVVEFCIYEIERRGLETEGLYRVSGSHEEIERLRMHFDSDCVSDPIQTCMVDDVHALTGLLKLYFRLLPIPLITYAARRELVHIFRYCQDDLEKVKHVKRVLHETLPPANYAVLQLFMLHLKRVADYSDRNRMTEENLSRILVLTLMNHSTYQADNFLMPQFELSALLFMIKNARKIFTDNRQITYNL
ncbi:hypothetical protein M514_06078 [Trichuris suis]|uniref:RhoGAP domain protein n=1 Tax=Trichuris suis TaxID=68888 RepID=A0A085NKB3_9BILA|nr:hypothetical protein M513_06078 [Trichuris suis]KFD69909.1 hypothetical protein M514_06078 [Trichuris suis]